MLERRQVHFHFEWVLGRYMYMDAKIWRRLSVCVVSRYYKLLAIFGSRRLVL